MTRRPRDEAELDRFLGSYLNDSRRSSPTTNVSTNRHRVGRNRRILVVLLLTGVLVGTVAISWWSYLAPGPASRPVNRLSAAIIDELSLTDPNPSFLTNATSTLTTAGYHVDYFPPDRATVNFFQMLPTLGYGLLIVRAHSSRNAIITSQVYSRGQYVWPQLTGGLSDEQISNGYDYFAITSDFVSSQMQGSFQGAAVIVMGCETLESPDLAASFIHRGAGAFIGWNNFVSAQYMDGSAARLLKLIAQGNSPQEAVQLTGAIDPVYHSRLAVLDSSTLASDQQAATSQILQQLAIAAALFVAAPLALALILRRLWRM